MRRTSFGWMAAAIAALAPCVALGGDKEDQATADQIAVVLRDSGKMRNYSVGVKYKNGTVWLSGRVASEQQMQSALQVVSDIEGVGQIVNGLSVNANAKAAKSAKPSARRVSATGADLATPGASQPTADSDVAPAGYHAVQARRAARHAPPAAGFDCPPGDVAPPAYDQPHMPNYAWPSYAASPNYAAVTYPKQYSPTAFPFIGPFYPYPQVPLGWRKVSLEWDDGWWFLDFYDRNHH